VTFFGPSTIGSPTTVTSSRARHWIFCHLILAFDLILVNPDQDYQVERLTHIFPNESPVSLSRRLFSFNSVVRRRLQV